MELNKEINYTPITSSMPQKPHNNIVFGILMLTGIIIIGIISIFFLNKYVGKSSITPTPSPVMVEPTLSIPTQIPTSSATTSAQPTLPEIPIVFEQELTVPSDDKYLLTQFAQSVISLVFQTPGGFSVSTVQITPNLSELLNTYTTTFILTDTESTKITFTVKKEMPSSSWSITGPECSPDPDCHITFPSSFPLPETP